MTDTTTTSTELPDVVLPAGRDPLDDLTAGELGTIGRLLKYDPYTAVKDPAVGLRWPALAHLCWVWEKRTNPAAKLDPWMGCTTEQISHALRMDEPDDTAGDDGGAEENPTDSTPAS